MAASAGHEVKGKVAVLHGTVKAISPDGVVRVLTVNSLIYADDKIITGGDGSISIVFDSVPPTQLDLGRMSEVQITEDVYGGHATPGAAADAAAEQEAIQTALLQGDQPLQLDATAAGGELSAGGGHPVFVVNPNWSAVTPESGAETRGITWGGIEETRFDPTEEQSPTNLPTAGEATVNLYDAALNQAVSNTLAHDFGADGAGTITLLNAVIPEEMGLSVTMNSAGTEMFVYQGQTLVMTVTVTDPATGACTVVQNNALVHPINADESSLIIHYQVTDGTGDTANGTMNINIFDDFPSVSANGSPQFYDANVGTTQIIATGDLGHDFGADVPGSISYLATGAPSGYTYVKDGSNLLVKYGGADGTTVLTLTLDANGSYTVAQNAAAHHPAGSDSMDFNISYQVVDADGDTSVGTLTINVVDALPIAHVDTGSANEGATLTVDAAAGVLPNDFFGADGKVIANGGVVGVAAGSDASNPVAGSVDTGIAGQYGTLTLHADGSYTYVSSANAITQNVSDTFVYTIQDGDGDLSTTTLTINLTDSGLSATTDSVTVNEAALDMVKDGLDLAAGTVDGSDPKSTAETVQGTLADNAIGGFGTLTYSLVGSDAGAYGKIAINADGTYTYTLTKPIIGPTADDGTNPETGDTFTYKVADANGNYVTNTITVTVTDDVPTAHIDSGSGNEGMTINVDAAAGVLANDVAGADGITLVGVAAGSDTSHPVAGNVGQSIAGQYGSLTLQADGSYTYVSTANAITQNASDTFVYTIKDGDGDTSTTTLTINLADSGLAATPDSATVSEAALDLVKDGLDLAAGKVTGTNPGSTAETVQGTLTDNASGGFGTLTYALVGSDAGTYGKIAINADGTYTYTLINPVVDGDSSEPADTFTYRVTDAYGNTLTNTITINALDDSPKVPVDPVTNTIPNGAGDYQGILVNMGADHPGTIAIAGNGLPTNLTSLGQPVTYVTSADGSTITAVAGGSTVFVLSTHGPDGSYDFQMLQPLDLTKTVTDFTSNPVGGGGPKPAYYIYHDGTFSSDAALPGHGGVALTISTDAGDNINPSNVGMGVNNNWMDNHQGTEHVIFDVNGSDIYGANIGIGNMTSGETLNYTVHYNGGVADSSGTIHAADLVNGMFTFGADPSKTIDSIDLWTGDTATDVRILTFETFHFDITKSVDLKFNFTATDSDGDPASGSLTVTVNNAASTTDWSSYNKVIGTDAAAGAADSLTGTAGNDVLVGKSGADVLKGLGGTNVYDGGSGADTFTITKGETARLLDYKSSEGDKVALDFSLGTSYKVTTEAASDGMAKVLVETGGSTTTIFTSIPYEVTPTPGGELDNLLGQIDPSTHHS